MTLVKPMHRGYKHPCIVAPCGAGKTFIVAEMARLATAKHNRGFILSPQAGALRADSTDISTARCGYEPMRCNDGANGNTQN